MKEETVDGNNALSAVRAQEFNMISCSAWSSRWLQECFNSSLHASCTYLLLQLILKIACFNNTRQVDCLVWCPVLYTFITFIKVRNNNITH